LLQFFGPASVSTLAGIGQVDDPALTASLECARIEARIRGIPRLLEAIGDADDGWPEPWPANDLPI
jgi:hypothetical protein